MVPLIGCVCSFPSRAKEGTTQRLIRPVSSQDTSRRNLIYKISPYYSIGELLRMPRPSSNLNGIIQSISEASHTSNLLTATTAIFPSITSLVRIDSVIVIMLRSYQISGSTGKIPPSPASRTNFDIVCRQMKAF